MILTIDAVSRKTIRKSDLTVLRAEGKIPANVYGYKMESKSITLNKADFMKAYKKSFREVTFYSVQVDGEKYFSVLKEKQVHPVTREFLHLDFMVIPSDSNIDFDVPINYSGEPIGIKAGGTMDVILRSVKISCFAGKVPDAINIDVSNLDVGTSLHVKDLPQGDWEYKDNPENAVIVIHAKRGEAPTEDSETTPEQPKDNA